MISGKISCSKQSIIQIYDLDAQTITSFDNTPLMRATAWHPDGIRLAYGVDKVYCLNTHTGDVEQITPDDVKASYPAWHPDGYKLLYTVDSEDIEGQLCVHNLITQDKIYLSLGIRAFQAEWHPNGQTIVFVGIVDGTKHIFKLDLDCLRTNDCSHAIKQLTTEGRFNHAPVWSPNGSLIAFERYNEQLRYWAIVLIDENGHNLKQLTDSAINGHHPTWSQDSEYIAFECETEDTTSDLCVTSINGLEFSVLQKDSGVEPDWFQYGAG